MLISPPFLPNKGTLSDEDWINAAMLGGAFGDGAFPVGQYMEWHGGLHLTAPRDELNNALPVRAVADGIVVFVREPKRAADLPEDDPLKYGNGFTSNAVVVILHETDIGADAQGNITSVKFYSIYLHLFSIRPAIQVGKSIFRKDIIGQAGHIDGAPDKIHFEICCDNDNLKQLTGRSTGQLNTSKNGRSDAVFGEIYFYISKSTPIYGSEPALHLKEATRIYTHAGETRSEVLQPVYSTADDLIVGIDYSSTTNGTTTITTYHPDGTEEGIAICEDRAEYLLYKTAHKICAACPDNARPSVSAIHELLRYGRIVGTDTLAPVDFPYWRKINFPGGVGWIDLNLVSIRKFSDADFPDWKGWKLIDDDDDLDGVCNSEKLRTELFGAAQAADRNAQLTPANLLAAAGLMKKAICKFPSEWDASTFDQRFKWRNTPGRTMPEAMSDQDYKKLEKHVEALCFDFPDIFKAQWCFDPRAFIQHFRRCGWLSAKEFQRIYPDTKYPAALSREGRGRTPASVRSTYLPHINVLARKFLINTPIRLTHFFGQGAVESKYLCLMLEGSVDYNRNPAHPCFQPETNGYYVPGPHDTYLNYLEGRLGNVDAGDGPKFRGRGMKQLTGRENYSKYWVYRGWISSDSFDAHWWTPPPPHHAPRRPPIIPDPQIVVTNDYNAIDAGCWYWEAGSASTHFESINSSINSNSIDRDAVFAVSSAINGINSRTHEPNALEQRLNETIDAAKILLDQS